jgi:hypothetical protein
LLPNLDTVSTVTLQKFRIMYSQEFTREFLENVQCNSRWDLLRDSAVLSFHASLYGHKGEPDVVKYHSVPKNWWNHLKQAINAWIAATNDRLRLIPCPFYPLSVDYSYLPEAWHTISLCPHLPGVPAGDHVKWVIPIPPRPRP